MKNKETAAVFMWVLLCCSKATAEEAGEIRLWAARACFGEASFAIQDCLPVLHVVKKLTEMENKTNKKQGARSKTQKHTTYVEKLRAVSFAVRPGRETSLTGKQLERWQTVKILPWGAAPFWPAKWNARWAKIRELVMLFFEGRTRDPCKTALYWGGPMDVPAPYMRPVSCANNAAGMLKEKKKPLTYFTR
jgi:hypothetical protein